MSITIREKVAPFWFKLDDEDPQSAEFHLRPLTELEFIDVQNGMSVDGGQFYLDATAHRSALAAGLIGWRNVLDDTGAAVKFSLSAAHQLPALVLRTVVTKIVSSSLLSPAEKKT